MVEEKNKEKTEEVKSKEKSVENSGNYEKGSLDLDGVKKGLELSDEEIQELSDKLSQEEIEDEIKDIEKGDSDKAETLIPLESYIKCAVHLGTKVITPHMRKYVYKRRADGLAVINTSLIDKKLRDAIDFLLNYEPKDIYLACKREAGWNSVEKFSEATGIRIFTKKYPPGITTNLELEDFFETELTIICDPWIDKNALNDTAKLGKPVMSLCDTNNFTTNVTKIIPCNNKSKKSIGCVLFILARAYCESKKIPFEYQLEDFTGVLE